MISMEATAPYTAPQELHDLAFRYGLAVDIRDAAMLSSIFTRNGVIRGHGQSDARYTGAAGWSRMIAEVSASFGRTMHSVFNQTFDIAPDGTISGLTTGVASHVLPAEPVAAEQTLVDFAMRYHNRYGLEDGLEVRRSRAGSVMGRNPSGAAIHCKHVGSGTSGVLSGGLNGPRVVRTVDLARK